MHHHRCLLMTLATLVLLSGAPDAAAQSSTQPDATATGECRDIEAEAEDLATELAECMLGRSRARGETSGQASAHAVVVAGLRAELATERGRREELRLKLDRAPEPLRVTGWTLAAGCVATLATAGARWALTDTLDVWLLAVGGVQCVGGGLALTWGE